MGKTGDLFRHEGSDIVAPCVDDDRAPNFNVPIGICFILYSTLVVIFYGCNFMIDQPLNSRGVAHILSVGLAAALTAAAVFSSRPSAIRYALALLILVVVGEAILIDVARRELLVLVFAEVLACGGLHFLRV